MEAPRYEELPLFPLNTVLFPYGQLPLHIFEPRYREMIAHCLENDAPFGIVLIRQGAEVATDLDSEEIDEHFLLEPEIGSIAPDPKRFAEPYLIGTFARIRDVHRYEDGRFDITVVGEGRFRIRGFNQSHNYLVGQIEPVTEEVPEDLENLEGMMDISRGLFERLVSQLFAVKTSTVHVVFPVDAAALSFQIANLLQLTNLQRQQMLETTDTMDRFEMILPILKHHVVHAESLVRPEPGAPLKSEDFRTWVYPN